MAGRGASGSSLAELQPGEHTEPCPTAWHTAGHAPSTGARSQGSTERGRDRSGEADEGTAEDGDCGGLKKTQAGGKLLSCRRFTAANVLSGRSNRPFRGRCAPLSYRGRCQAVVKVIFCLYRQMFRTGFFFFFKAREVNGPHEPHAVI